MTMGYYEMMLKEKDKEIEKLNKRIEELQKELNDFHRFFSSPELLVDYLNTKNKYCFYKGVE